MEKLVICGQKRLEGEVCVSGAKNAAVAILPATILSDGKCTIENVPDILDVAILKEILKELGASINQINDSSIQIDTSNINSYVANNSQIGKLRASYYLMGALLGRFKKAIVPFPGGCDFGVRPIDQHIKGFEALGAKVEIEHGKVIISAEKLVGAPVYLDVVSVGATVNIMLAAVKAEGVTTIENAAKEPHIVDLANFLNAMGADIKGAGTDVIKIRGKKHLKGGHTYTIIPDQIEAGTYMIAAAATNGDVLVKNIIPKHMESLTAKLQEMNVTVDVYDDSIRVRGSDKIQKVNIKTLPYPGFPTDLQPPVTSLLCRAEGTSIITEGVWDNRFQYVDELKRMGAKIKVEGRTAVIEGPVRLTGAPVRAMDLRAGAAMVIAGLMAHGETVISNIHYIDRGYERLDEKLRSLGADIQRIK
ncbi:UDP-N-acetylglucosamine 1-carboxyvinyltransferase 3 [Thermoclostridium stercorarium subsp. stercorarium DSM 8532]|uniref:UDP-N-acetylglucosamine 1-carboxyvinyltransferase n=2 Tax=Thermoclostridium stercorarium TaxID=1510 RepID=L7VTM8_THES1|nr:UDP-N-acetylglucosamine 1-carboxyvinyltransferase [Thermoclostridium stercorarium]AGC69701.1 UDP-N-acetylglucosamine 1-carboxyvinyltransferase 3 [Thermoclostridium stercorarium subsp. stercorarium DSM 8532]ANX02556.1 UDP-N-acetylglucosamine 1-carboxyvinyltransferase [Thermoclostridium stercorarium subsp. leptospartum DSM 9219]